MANLNLKKTVVGSVHSASGKGTWRRPKQISDAELARRWALAFPKKQRRKT